MTKGAGNLLALLETHVEKIILGVAGLFALWLAYSYLINTPNTRQFEGQALKPDKLNDAILTSAKKLENAVKNAKADETPVENSSQQLKQRFMAGILGPPGPNMPRLEPTLPTLASFGSRIEVPGLAETEEAAGNITLVTPLPPSQPVVRTGRSLAKREPLSISVDVAPKGEKSAAAAQPTEAAWVSIAAYFDREGQRKEMEAKKYAGDRSRVYIAGVEVQRQEMLSTGGWSEWKDVRSRAMPDIKVPDPVFDDATGALLNKDVMDQMLSVVRGEQKTIMQPEFLSVEAGDFWEVPPLDGLQEDEHDEDAAVAKPAKEKKEPKPRQAPAPPPVGGGRSAGGGGGGGRGGFVGGGDDTLGGGGGAGGGQSAAAAEQKRKADARKAAKADMREAGKAFGQKKYEDARGALNKVINNADAPKALKSQAHELQARIDKIVKATGGGAGGGMSGGGRAPGGMIGDDGAMPPGGGRFAGGGGGAGAPMAAPTTTPLIQHPERGTPAVWFHDDSVEAGKTYRYRMRVKLWNRYVGRMKALVTPGDARKALIAGEWSQPSEPVTVTPRTYFFVSGGVTGKPSAVGAEVWRWLDGNWIKQRFDVEVGDTIGGERRVKTGKYDDKGDEVLAMVDFNTGAVVTDVRKEEVKVRLPGKGGSFTHRPVDSLVVAYVDPADGQVKERAAELDRSDPIRNKLKEEELP